MSGISQRLPVGSRPFTKTARFTAVYNEHTVGRYDFNNQQIELFEFEPNSVYFISSLEIGGDLAESIYANSIDVVPQLILKKKITGDTLYRYPVSIVKYADNRDVSSFVDSSMGNNALVANLKGLLAQNVETIGESAISLNITVNAYAISDSNFVRAFRDPHKHTAELVNGWSI